jgi:hypothetical protein
LLYRIIYRYKTRPFKNGDNKICFNSPPGVNSPPEVNLIYEHRF